MRQTITQDKFLFHQGRNYRSYHFLGAHPKNGKDFSDGTVFRLWAPRAKSVSLVSEFNHWDPAKTPMLPLKDDASIWEVTCPEMKQGDLYKFVLETDEGTLLWKADPYAFTSEQDQPDGTNQRASIVWNIEAEYPWADEEWLKNRGRRNPYRSPMNIYEVHLGSWRRKKDGSFYSYRDLAKSLIPYAKNMGYTHLELLPIMEYPFEGSWGYQVTGYYSVTSRYGTPDDFRYFVNQAHRSGLGIILDWVPAHFPKDAFALSQFDGHPLYEDSNPYRREHKGWGTYAFDFGRPEVLSFLISNAFFYCEQYHVDGLRVDAVAAMLYLNYCREDGEWIPNQNGGNENLEAVAFLQNMNQDVLTHFPGVLTIAEESTTWPNVTKPPQTGGLGFNFKWNMGWMNDSLDYFRTDPYFRAGKHHKLTFSISYGYSENFILPISHDEVVHGKHSMLDKMPGEYENKFAQLRAFYTYMFTHPGKKLTFMGMEFGQFIEWNEKQSLDWLLLDYEKHHKLKSFVKKLNHLYLDTPALWALDDTYDGFDWLDADNQNANVYTYLRKTKEGSIVVIAINLSGNNYSTYEIGVPDGARYRRLLDTDMVGFGGTGQRKKIIYKIKKGSRNGQKQYITVALPKFSAIILEREE